MAYHQIDFYETIRRERHRESGKESSILLCEFHDVCRVNWMEWIDLIFVIQSDLNPLLLHHSSKWFSLHIKESILFLYFVCEHYFTYLGTTTSFSVIVIFLVDLLCVCVCSICYRKYFTKSKCVESHSKWCEFSGISPANDFQCWLVHTKCDVIYISYWIIKAKFEHFNKISLMYKGHIYSLGECFSHCPMVLLVRSFVRSFSLSLSLYFRGLPPFSKLN